VASGTPTDLTRAAASDEVVFTTTPGLAVGDLTTALGLRPGAVREGRPGEYVIDAEGTPALVAALATWMRDTGTHLDELRNGRRSLEEVFLRLTTEGSRESLS
jgi:ABC-2 type transport system ATP-binding protein